MSFDLTWPVLVIDCKWNEWGVWGKCDGVCGYRYRFRTSVGPFFGGKACLERGSVDKRPCKWTKVDGVTKRCRECFSPIKLKGLIMSKLWNDSHFVSKPSIVDGKNGPSGVIATKRITRERERGASRVLTMTAKTARENQSSTFHVIGWLQSTATGIPGVNGKVWPHCSKIIQFFEQLGNFGA